MITSFIIHYFGSQARSRFGGHCPRWGRFAQGDCRHEMRPMTFLDPGAFPGSNPIASVESGNHLALELETRCLTATAVKLGCHPWRAGTCNFGPIGPPYGSIIRAMASLCSMASKNLEMYRTFAS